ncbi:MAG: helix-turn-helix transcriptional regulator [Clostridia bacterium]|nr:helix-turn-helix transcriptional regulator [Clostridia bacterium]
MDYAQRMRALREDNDLLQKEIAEVLNTNQKVYSRYETEENEMPIRHLIALCKYYNVSADYFLGFTDTPKPLPKK